MITVKDKKNIPFYGKSHKNKNSPSCNKLERSALLRSDGIVVGFTIIYVIFHHSSWEFEFEFINGDKLEWNVYLSHTKNQKTHTQNRNKIENCQFVDIFLTQWKKVITFWSKEGNSCRMWHQIVNTPNGSSLSLKTRSFEACEVWSHY